MADILDAKQQVEGLGSPEFDQARNAAESLLENGPAAYMLGLQPHDLRAEKVLQSVVEREEAPNLLSRSRFALGAQAGLKEEAQGG